MTTFITSGLITELQTPVDAQAMTGLEVRIAEDGLFLNAEGTLIYSSNVRLQHVIWPASWAETMAFKDACNKHGLVIQQLKVTPYTCIDDAIHSLTKEEFRNEHQ